MKSRSAFTLLEMLVSTVLLACLIFFLARIFTGVDQFITSHRSDFQKNKIILKTLDSMRCEIGASVLKEEQNRFLNMYAVENDGNLYLYFCRLNRNSPLPLIEYVCYFLDQQNLYRASFKDSYLTNSNAYDWIQSASMQNALQQDNRGKLAGEIETFQAEFTKADGSSQISQWNDSSALPETVKISIQLKNKQTLSVLIFCRHYEILDY